MVPTIQDFDRAETRRIAAACVPLVAALTGAAAGQPWHYLLFGSLARGTARRGSDADIAIVGAERAEDGATPKDAIRRAASLEDVFVLLTGEEAE